MNRVQLTERDKRLIETINSYGLLATDQIKDLVFSKTDSHTMLRRLRALKRRKLIHSHHGLPNAKQVWTVGDNGARLFGQEKRLGINRNVIEHDVAVSTLRMILEKYGAASGFHSSHSLKSKANQSKKPEDRREDVLPDYLCAVRFKSGPKAVALELELIAKSKKRYQKILRDYSYKDSLQRLWYVVGHERIGTLLTEEVTKLSRTRPPAWFMWSLKDEVIHDLPNARIFVNGSHLKIRDLMVLTCMPTR